MEGNRRKKQCCFSGELIPIRVCRSVDYLKAGDGKKAWKATSVGAIKKKGDQGNS